MTPTALAFAGARGDQLGEARFDAQGEAFAHRLFLGGAVGAAAQDERLGAGVVAIVAIVAIDAIDAEPRPKLHLQSFAHGFPGPIDQRAFVGPQLTLGRADDVAAAARPQPLQVCLADHAAIERPDA